MICRHSLEKEYTWGWNGKKGKYKETWAQSGKPKCIEHYTENGEKAGLWQEWDYNGKLIREENYAEMPYYTVMFDSNGYPIKRYYYKEDLSTNSVQYFYPGTDKVMKMNTTSTSGTSSVITASFMRMV